MIPVNTDAITSNTAGLNESLSQPEASGRQGDALRLQKAQALDRNTLGGIYDEFQPLLYSYIFRRVGNVEVARDLTADVFGRFLQATANGNGPDDHLRAWLYRVAHNIVIDHYRRQEHRNGQPLEESLVSGEVAPDAAAEHRLQCEGVRSALEQLTDDQQEVIALKFLEGMTNDEVAQITQRSVGAVKALQHRALAALRRHLISQEEENVT
ncbi:MAG: sigma-70 family RNA polymerase sigma factor [Chloroflexota bacterium]|jgi:RNA polymerase sigma-70 factor (ECF subfamily)